MMGMCQRGEACPYSQDHSISNKGTIPRRFYQSGSVIMDQPDKEPIQQLTSQMDSFTFDQSDGSEGSYETSLGSFDTNGYPDLDQSLAVDSGFLDPTFIDGGTNGCYSLPLGTISPTYYTSAEYPDSLYGEGVGHFTNPSELSSPSLELSSPEVVTTIFTDASDPTMMIVPQVQKASRVFKLCYPNLL